jgi:hypothetical protein
MLKVETEAVLPSGLRKVSGMEKIYENKASEEQ